MAISPAFQFYPSDFLADESTLAMSAEEIGAYILLLCVCWRENGLQNDLKKLARISRISEKRFSLLWKQSLASCFYVSEADGKFHHKRLDLEFAKQLEWKEKSRKAGVASGEARRNQRSTSDEPTFDSGSTKPEPNGNSSCLHVFSNTSNEVLLDETEKIEPKEKPKRKPDPLYEIFANAFLGAKGTPYQNKQADFVHLADCRKKYAKANWELTEERWTRGVQNYFASPQHRHTLADLCTKFADFYKAASDRYGKPAENGTEGVVIAVELEEADCQMLEICSELPELASGRTIDKVKETVSKLRKVPEFRPEMIPLFSVYWQQTGHKSRIRPEYLLDNFGHFLEWQGAKK